MNDRRYRLGAAGGAALGLAVVALAAGLWYESTGPRRAERERSKAEKRAAELQERGLAEERALRYGVAGEHLREALEMRRSLNGADHPATWESLRSLARLRRESQDYLEETALLQELAQSIERVRGSDHPELAEALNDLGTAQGHAGDLMAAEESFRRAGDIHRYTNNPAHSLNLVRTHLSWIAELRGQFSLAEAGYRRVLTWWERYLGNEHPQTAWTLQHLALVVAAQGRSRQAESVLRRALAIRENLEGPNSKTVGEILHGLGRIVSDQGRYDEAVALYERALAVRLASYPEDHPNVRATREALDRLTASVR